ncbi:MAG TPA: type I-C CRISPR-associated protein Cas8c/Csd1, partial [Ignavibacteriaceae bacterium]|nr:type I-C CRISPR-associated protein Cas8c/Csd1 [Ignavibacteriaceae bacterium]
MILKALYDYYERKPEIHAPIGYEKEELDFIIIIDKEGNFADLQNKRENKRGKEYFVPKAVVRTASVKPNLLWDKIEYITGFSKDEKKSPQAKKYNAAFIDKLKTLPEELKEEAGIKSLLLFYGKNQTDYLIKHQNWEECLKVSGWISFQLDGEKDLIANSEAAKKYQEKEFISGNYEEDDAKKLKEGVCLITGEKKIIKRLNTELRLPGSDKNVKIVAFQKNSGFDSYGKEQAYNAPISILAENNYSAALKHLINSKTNKKIVSDTTILFWSERKTEEINPEEVFSWVIAAQKVDEDNPDTGVDKIETFINSIFNGQLATERTSHFYVLGLSPNAARISVRFWKTPSIEDFGKNIKKHFDDFEIIRGSKEPKYLSLYQILSATALGYKMDNVTPNLAGSFVESIIDGTPYPTSLLQQCIRRIRAEQNVNRSRASILKAYLNRFNRIHNQNKKEITMSLDLTNINVAYRIGRLFAVLEKIQEEANPGINATIRDRFYGSASSSPITVFPRLLSLKNSHLKKLNDGKKIYFEKLIGEILNEMKSFP